MWAPISSAKSEHSAVIVQQIKYRVKQAPPPNHPTPNDTTPAKLRAEGLAIRWRLISPGVLVLWKGVCVFISQLGVKLITAPPRPRIPTQRERETAGKTKRGDETLTNDDRADGVCEVDAVCTLAARRSCNNAERLSEG